ncbi:MAG: MarR family transcriptional regulator [Pseudonocardia sp.]|nr:MarR family transcriptional regulator [Pseudonocardia sp.]
MIRIGNGAVVTLAAPGSSTILSQRTRHYNTVSLDQRESPKVTPGQRAEAEQALQQALRIHTMRTVLLIQAIASQARINPIDLQCLNLLALNGPMTPSRLAEAMCLTKGGAITAMIQRLENAGYLERTRDLSDRRQVLVNITPGEPLRRLMTHFEPVTTALAALTADYTTEQLRLITQFTADINNMINRLRPTPV